MSDWSADVCSSDLREGPAQAGVLAEGVLRTIPIADIGCDALVAEPDRLRVLQIGIGLHPGGIGGRQTLQHVQIAGAQVGDPSPEARRVGQECVSTYRSRGSPSQYKKNMQHSD